jgi:hypothetical protein
MSHGADWHHPRGNYNRIYKSLLIPPTRGGTLSSRSMKIMNKGQLPKIVKPFKYGGKMLKKDFEFVPDNGKWDEQIMDNPKMIQWVDPKEIHPSRRAKKVKDG